MLTSAKLLTGYLVVEITRELDKELLLLWQPLVTKTNSVTSNKSLKDRYLVGNSQENSTRSLFLIRVLFIQMSPGPCYYYLTLPYSPYSILMSTSLLTQGHHMYFMCPDVIFQTILPCSRLVTSHQCDLSCDFLVMCLLHHLSRKIK